MPKALNELQNDDVFLAEEVECISQTQPLTGTTSREAVDDVAYFTHSHGLQQYDDVFQKAAALVQGDRESAHLTDEDVEALNRETSHKWSQPRALYFTIFVCALGAIEQGWAQTGMNGANLYLPKALGLDPASNRGTLVLGLINCGLFLGQAVFGAWLAGPLCETLGRRGAIYSATVLCLVGNVGSASSTSWQWLLFFRIVLGTGTGLNGVVVNVFTAESAPTYIRGGLAVTWQMFVAFGILDGFLANVAFYNYDDGLIWRLQLIAPLVPIIPLLLCIYACPESAAYQMKHSRYLGAFRSLSRLRNTELQAAIETYSGYVSHRLNNKLDEGGTQSFLGSVKALLTIARNRHALYAAYFVQVCQQICGINIIAFYSSTIFSSSGFTPLAALWASVIFGAVNWLGALPAVYAMDTFGRRGLLLWSLPPMALTMLLASLSFNLPDGLGRLIALASTVYIFCALYSPGMGPVPCAYGAEVFGVKVRDVGMSVSVFTASIWATALSLTFPTLLQNLGERGSFGLYAGLNVVAWILCFVFVRETKGKDLEDLDAVFEEGVVAYVVRESQHGIGIRRKLRRSEHSWTAVRAHEDLD
ncbi:hypothetical protein LTR86_003925 [Recurvomyces mirabilis]|nr:hypothetical protein LTR86_003925 [Recurvomyces mirabilis]